MIGMILCAVFVFLSVYFMVCFWYAAGKLQWISDYVDSAIEASESKNRIVPTDMTVLKETCRCTHANMTTLKRHMIEHDAYFGNDRDM